VSFQPPPHLSPSSLGTYNQCQLKFKYSKIDGRQEDPTEETLLGNFVHDVLENLYGLEPEHRTLKNAQSIAGELWQNGWGDRATPWILKKHYGSQDAVRGFRWKAFWCIENLWKIENPTSLSPSGLEHELNGTIGGVTIKGFIDRYSPLDDGGFVISDYKTGKTPKPNWVGDKFTQLLIYSHLLLSTGVGEAKEVSQGRG
jgi:putative RecB family exonuclease